MKRQCVSEKSVLFARMLFDEKTVRLASRCVEEWFDEFFDEVFSDLRDDETEFALAVIYLSVMNDISDDHFPVYNQFYKEKIEHFKK